MRMVSRLSRYVCRLALAGLMGIALGGALAAAQEAPPEQPQADQPQAEQPHAQRGHQPHGQQNHAQESHTPRAHVYLLRGLLNVFSLGMDSLGEELNRKGVETTVDNYADWPSLADRAAVRYKAGTENPIILIGHSLGADAVLDMADYLRRRDVPVALVIPFDGTHTLVAPSNVGRVVNLTQRAYAYVRPGVGFKGSFVNVDISSDTSIDHITIDKAARTHARAITEVMAVVGHPSPAPKTAQPPGASPSASPGPAAKPAASAAPADDTTGTTAPPSGGDVDKPAPSASVAPSPPSAAVTPPASPAAPPAPSAAATSPAPEPPRANEGSTAPPAAAHAPAQDTSASSLSSERPSPPPGAATHAAPASKPAPARPPIKPAAPAIQD